jgi:hypothetical protein
VTHLVEPDAPSGEEGVCEGREGGGGRHRGGEATAAVDAQHVLRGKRQRRSHLAYLAANPTAQALSLMEGGGVLAIDRLVPLFLLYMD